MSKSVLISINPQSCELIANGKKTIEIRRSRPKLDTPFKVYIYCTKAKKKLIDVLKDGDNLYGETYHGKTAFIKVDEGSVCDMWGKRQKVIGEFMCDAIISHCEMANADIAEQQGRIKREELSEYSNGKQLYGWHISDLEIYNNPKGLSEFWTKDTTAIKNCEYREPSPIIRRYCRKNAYWCNGCRRKQITRPPQSWCFVEEAQD